MGQSGTLLARCPHGLLRGWGLQRPPQTCPQLMAGEGMEERKVILDPGSRCSPAPSWLVLPKDLPAISIVAPEGSPGPLLSILPSELGQHPIPRHAHQHWLWAWSLCQMNWEALGVQGATAHQPCVWGCATLGLRLDQGLASRGRERCGDGVTCLCRRAERFLAHGLNWL